MKSVHFYNSSAAKRSKQASKKSMKKNGIDMYVNNKAGYTATLVACGWAGAVLEKITWASGQET